MNVKLYSRDFYTNANNKSIIVLHGLFGSSKNWISFANEMSKDYNLFLVDQRNHGNSGHSDNHSLMDMVNDLAYFIQDKNIHKPILLGHSMGGLVAMLYALSMDTKLYPQIDKLIIQDIAPREYSFNYSNEIESMRLDISSCKSRKEIDFLMTPLLPDLFIRQFLQMNLERRDSGEYYWRINVDAISNSRKMFGAMFLDFHPILLQSLFILGGLSPFIVESDYGLIKQLFPKSVVHTIPNGGHYLHYFQGAEFCYLINNFLNNIQM